MPQTCPGARASWARVPTPGYCLRFSSHVSGDRLSHLTGAGFWHSSSYEHSPCQVVFAARSAPMLVLSPRQNRLLAQIGTAEPTAGDRKAPRCDASAGESLDVSVVIQVRSLASPACASAGYRPTLPANGQPRRSPREDGLGVPTSSAAGPCRSARIPRCRCGQEQARHGAHPRRSTSS